ncbi:efflux RND transporter periplasmic adaptor subunit [Croceibacterium aestuarii]|uniref:efflux RND transporter periplasmic adaptor subunit n=1 Tax=Croceibacterium aestuarii TaxID=3064139 RepID=UPI00272ECD7F|nr:efflux RND transporter periplasmic adaptor subunit [Croceibacterium sp. D39]
MFDTPFDRSEDQRGSNSPNDGDLVDGYPARMQPMEMARDEEGEYRGRHARRNRRIVLVVAMAAALLAAWWFLRTDVAPAAAPPPPEVTVAQPIQREVTEWDDFIGRFEPSRAVEVRPRVSGQVTAVHFTDGQFVRAGAPLFSIDARPFRASLAEAQASAASASSALSLARSNLARAQRLVAEDAVAANEIDRLQAEVRMHEAQLAAARAQVRSRQLDVEFTTVRAPISGRISDRRVDAGNLVAAGSGQAATLLTTINAVDPIYFAFEGSESTFLKTRREGLDKKVPVDIRLADEPDYRWHGSLDFVDNGLDAHSGTIRARARVRNPDGFLTPGLFGNMRMATGGTEQALLVPDTAITTDQTRKLVMVVDRKNAVAAREVELGPLVDGLRVVRKGLAPTDRVIIDGVQLAMPGQTVKPKQGKVPEPGAAYTEKALDEAPASAATLAN